jgi:predicted Zn-dependent protease
VWAALLLGLCLTGSGCSLAPDEGPGHRKQALALTPQQEWSLGEQAYKQVLGKSKVVHDGPPVKRIRILGSRIAEAAKIEPLQREINLRLKGYRFDWEFNLLENKQVNAFCLPGGKVAVFTGLLVLVGNDDDMLATVLSHEIAHALAHHASERIARQQMYQHALDAVNGAMGTMDPAKRKQLIGLLGAGAQAGTLAYDRQQESEADHIGIFLMTFAGYDPAKAVTLWERMQQKAGGKGPPEMLSDHPSDARRIAKIRQWVPQALAARDAYKQGRIAPPGRVAGR